MRVDDIHIFLSKGRIMSRIRSNWNLTLFYVCHLYMFIGLTSVQLLAMIDGICLWSSKHWDWQCVCFQSSLGVPLVIICSHPFLDGVFHSKPSSYWGWWSPAASPGPCHLASSPLRWAVDGLLALERKLLQVRTCNSEPDRQKDLNVQVQKMRGYISTPPLESSGLDLSHAGQAQAVLTWWLLSMPCKLEDDSLPMQWDIHPYPFRYTPRAGRDPFWYAEHRHHFDSLDGPVFTTGDELDNLGCLNYLHTSFFLLTFSFYNLTLFSQLPFLLKTFFSFQFFFQTSHTHKLLQLFQPLKAFVPKSAIMYSPATCWISQSPRLMLCLANEERSLKCLVLHHMSKFLQQLGYPCMPLWWPAHRVLGHSWTIKVWPRSVAQLAKK